MSKCSHSHKGSQTRESEMSTDPDTHYTFWESERNNTFDDIGTKYISAGCITTELRSIEIQNQLHPFCILYIHRPQRICKQYFPLYETLLVLYEVIRLKQTHPWSPDLN